MSIFSINDNSNYTSILSQSKANKESKENSKINFANAFLKQNASKLNEIQSANSQTLARSEILDNQSNSNNNNSINKNYYTKTTSPNYNISSEFKNSIYTLKYKQADISNTSTNTAYGYSVDKDGYMGEDFNKAAGLPKDFKIHKSTLDEIERVAEYNVSDIREYLGVDKYYSNIDMAETIKQYYNLFSNALNQSFPSDKNSFSEKDINSMPKGYAISGIKSMDFNNLNNRMNITHLRDFSNSFVSNIYQTPEQMKEAESLYIQSGALIDGINGHSFGLSLEEIKNVSKGEDWLFNPDMSVYPQNEDGNYPKEALFMSFLKSYGGGLPVESSKTTLNPKVEAYNRAMAKESFNGSGIALDDIMTGKVDFASLLKGYAQKGWLDADIYAMEKGVVWQNTSIGYGGAWFDREFNQAKTNGWKASSESINSFANSIMDRLNKLIGQTRV
ncbi:Cj0814 family flagellar-dependent secreted protein [Campylobacter sp. VTCC 70190]|uniref:Cj0814 family flagellar-dependent secreted protein n=1 Tax=Campylobacter sp. VTCC 70190 TaxID=3392118 RepID=UPI00398EEA39